MRRFLQTTILAMAVAAGAVLCVPQTAHADRDWDSRYSAYRHRWDDHRHWRNRYYQPYYHHHYHTQPYYSRYYSSYPRTYNYRPNYGYYGGYYGSPYGYRDYRYGGAVRVGPLQFYWR